MIGRKNKYSKSLTAYREQRIPWVYGWLRQLSLTFAPLPTVQLALAGPGGTGGPRRPAGRPNYKGVPINRVPPRVTAPPPRSPFPQPMPPRPPVVRGSYPAAPVKAGKGGKGGSKLVGILIAAALALFVGGPLLKVAFKGILGLIGFVLSKIAWLLLLFLAIVVALVVLVIYATKHDPHKNETTQQPANQPTPQPVQKPAQPASPIEKSAKAQKIAPFPRSGDPEADKVIAEGENYMQQLRQADVDIPDEQVSACIVRMEASGRKIFEFIAENPKKAPQIHKFMNYYLPTTLKLLKTYDKFGRQGVKGENISSTMYDIEGMMQTIATAFDKQLDSLFEAEAMDVSTDMTVLENILQQEGLTDSELLKK